MPGSRPRPLPPGRPRFRHLGLFFALGVAASAGPGGAGLRAQAPDRPDWRVGVGVGVAASLSGSDNGGEGPGLAVDAYVSRRAGERLRAGVRWYGSWFAGDRAAESRHLVAFVVELPLGPSPLVLRAGPGLSLATAVQADGPPPGDGPPGDLDIGIGDYGAAGATAGLAARFRLAGGVALEPSLDVVYHRAGGFNLVTAAFGGRLVFGG